MTAPAPPARVETRAPAPAHRPPAAPGDERPRLSPGEAHALIAQRLAVAPDELDGWMVAQNLSRDRFSFGNRELREYARTIASQAVLRRATQLVGPIRRATRPVREIMAEPFRGELEIDETLENLTGKEFPEREDWVVESREIREQQVVLMMDVSLSMAGENLAIAAVAAAVLALKMRSEDLGVVVFDNEAQVITRLEQRDTPERLAEEILSQPVRGYTNIEAALRVGARELRRGRNPHKAGLLITDGVFTAGGDPTHLAADFPRLFVLLTEDYKMNEDLCYRLASIGRGDVFRVKDQHELPARMLEIVNRILR